MDHKLRVVPSPKFSWDQVFTPGPIHWREIQDPFATIWRLKGLPCAKGEKGWWADDPKSPVKRKKWRRRSKVDISIYGLDNSVDGGILKRIRNTWGRINSGVRGKFSFWHVEYEMPACGTSRCRCSAADKKYAKKRDKGWRLEREPSVFRQ